MLFIPEKRCLESLRGSVLRRYEQRPSSAAGSENTERWPSSGRTCPEVSVRNTIDSCPRPQFVLMRALSGQFTLKTARAVKPLPSPLKGDQHGHSSSLPRLPWALPEISHTCHYLKSPCYKLQAPAVWAFMSVPNVLLCTRSGGRNS